METALSGQTGFFGKLPAAGDFVARALSPGLRPVLDRWVTMYLSELARDPLKWPEVGLRGIWSDAGQPQHALLIVPSEDSTGRRYPLTFCVACDAADQDGVDQWADRIIEKLDMRLHPAELLEVMAHIAPPDPSEAPLEPSVFWAEGPPQSLAETLSSV